MKKNYLALLLAVPMLLAGCSSEPAAPEVQEIELFSFKAENKDIMQTFVDEFNTANPDTKIVINAPADAGTVLKTRMAKNDMPEIIAMGGTVEFTDVQSAGMLLDLSAEPYAGNLQSEYVKMVYGRNKDKEEKMYGVPYATNASGIICNMDVFNEVGVEIPQTWDELIAAAESFKAAGKNPFIFTFKDVWTTMPSWNSMTADIIGSDFFDARRNDETTFVGTHEIVLEQYAQLLSYAQPDFMGMTYDDGNKAFANGEGAMFINGNWAINQMKAANAEVALDMTAFPSTNDASKNTITSGVDVLFAVVDNEATNEAAKSFISYVMEPEQAQRYTDDQFSFSSVKGVEQTDPSVANAQALIAQNRVSNFSDHYYPSGFDVPSVMSQFGLNVTNEMPIEENIASILADLDSKYDAVNLD